MLVLLLSSTSTTIPNYEIWAFGRGAVTGDPPIDTYINIDK
jgi:hypothetical protein